MMLREINTKKMQHFIPVVIVLYTHASSLVVTKTRICSHGRPLSLTGAVSIVMALFTSLTLSLRQSRVTTSVKQSNLQSAG